MSTLKRIYDWCRVKCARASAAFTLLLPISRRTNKGDKIKIEWFGKRVKAVATRTLLVLTMILFFCPGIIRVGGGSVSALPRFTYSGTYTMLDDGHGNWRIKFLTSGTLTFEKSTYIDVFLVGGGGGGAHANYVIAGGGGGGYTNKIATQIHAGSSYSIVVGAGGMYGYEGSANGFRGGTSSAFGAAAAGGYGGIADGGTGAGGNGGSGGSGHGGWNAGSNGSNGDSNQGPGGIGQGTTTREFGEATGALYAGGGGGAQGGQGGAGGGGNGVDSGYGGNGTTNSGGGGGGQWIGTAGHGGWGGSGIVIIRNQRAS